MAKLLGKRLWWYVLLIRATENSLAKIGLNMEFDEKRPKGRSKEWWINTLAGDLGASRLHRHEALDIANWRNRSTRDRLASVEEKDWKGEEEEFWNVWKNASIGWSTEERLGSPLENLVPAASTSPGPLWNSVRSLNIPQYDTRKLQAFVKTCIRYIIRIYWPDPISKEELRRRKGQTPVDVAVDGSE